MRFIETDRSVRVPRWRGPNVVVVSLAHLVDNNILEGVLLASVNQHDVFDKLTSGDFYRGNAPELRDEYNLVAMDVAESILSVFMSKALNIDNFIVRGIQRYPRKLILELY